LVIAAWQEIRAAPKEKWASAHSFLRVLRSAEGEARGQIRLLLKDTPISDEIQRFGAAFLLVIGLTITLNYDSDTSTGSSNL
jgi:hypothetical protein